MVSDYDQASIAERRWEMLIRSLRHRHDELLQHQAFTHL